MPLHFPWHHPSRISRILSFLHFNWLRHIRPEPHHRRSRLPFPLQIFLLTLTILGLTAGAILLKRAEDLRRQAAIPQAIPMLVEFKLNPKTGQVKLNRAAKISRLSDHKQTKTPPTNTYTLEQRLNNRAINTTSLTFVTHRQHENFDQLLNLPDAPESDPREPLEEPIAITTIPYYPGSKLILQSDTNKDSMSLDTQTLAVTLDTAPMIAPKTNTNESTSSSSDSLSDTSPDNTLNILFLSSNYPESESSLFTSDAGAMFEFLLTVPPFSTYKQSIRYQAILTPNLNCISPLPPNRIIYCDTFNVYQQAQAYVYDTVVVINNSNQYSGNTPYIGSNLAFVYRDVSALASKVLAHELGHSLFSLQDEYGYGVNLDPSSPVPWPNCDRSATCDKWSTDPRTGCFPTCAYLNLNRPTYNDSLMRSLYPEHGFLFGPVSAEHAARVIQTYLDPMYSSDFNFDGHLDYQDYLSLLTQPVDIFSLNSLASAFGK